jgi:hypothetical protein
MTAFVTERACKRANARAASARANVQTCKKTCKRACEHTLHTCSHGQCDLSVDCTCILLHLRPRKTTQVWQRAAGAGAAAEGPADPFPVVLGPPRTAFPSQPSPEKHRRTGAAGPALRGRPRARGATVPGRCGVGQTRKRVCFCGRRCFTDLDPRACITVVNSWLHIVHTLHATHKPSQVCLSLVRHKRKCRRSYQRDRAKESARGECAAEEERTHDERRL